MRKLYIVSFVYAVDSISIAVYAAFAKDGQHAEDLAKMYKSEGEKIDWDDYTIDVTDMRMRVNDKSFKELDSEEGWTGEGDYPVTEVFYWSRG